MSEAMKSKYKKPKSKNTNQKLRTKSRESTPPPQGRGILSVFLRFWFVFLVFDI